MWIRHETHSISHGYRFLFFGTTGYAKTQSPGSPVAKQGYWRPDKSGSEAFTGNYDRKFDAQCEGSEDQGAGRGNARESAKRVEPGGPAGDTERYPTPSQLELTQKRHSVVFDVLWEAQTSNGTAFA